MKAILLSEHGGPDKLTFADVPKPKPGKGETLVRVHAAALNRLDIWVRKGIPGLAIPLPLIPGSDAAGIVEESPNPLWIGQRVMVAPGVSCGKCDACRRGDDHLCETFQLLGQSRHGGYAPYLTVPLENLAAIPEGMSFEEAAAFPLVFMTAWHGLVTLGKVKMGETVLVHAGSGGVGMAAIQIAKCLGARVISTAGSAEKTARLMKLGAELAVNYKEGDFVESARQFTRGKGVDVVMDSVGQATFAKSLEVLGKGGRLLAFGSTSGREVGFDLRTLFGKNATVFGYRLGRREGLDLALKKFTAAKMAVVLDKTFPLAEAAAAQSYMEENRHFGKIVLTVK